MASNRITNICRMAIIRIQGEEEKSVNVYYEVDSEETVLGTGGMGQVRRGFRVDQKNGIRSEVAIKFLFDDLPDSTIERARREASIRINNDNVVNMLGFIETEDNGVMRYHVVSELLRGIMLYDLLNGKTTDSEGNEVALAVQLLEMRQSSPEIFAMTLMKGVLSGVVALHDRGYVHRDIDPSNIMITQDGKIKLLDFGIAKDLNVSAVANHQFTSAGVFMGKAGYASPELVLGDVSNQNETTDIYALGILLYELLTGHLPFEGPSNEVMQMQCKKKLPLKDIKNKDLRSIVAKATEKKQSDRYRTASAMRVALENAEASGANQGTISKRVFTNSGTPAIKPATEVGKSFDFSKLKDNKLVKLTLGLILLISVIVGAAVGYGYYKKADSEKRALIYAEKVNDSIAHAKKAIEEKKASLNWRDRLMKYPEADEINALKSAAQGAGKDGADAAYVYAGLLGRQSRVLPSDLIQKLIAEIPEDQVSAHSFYEKALDNDSTLYQAAYELGYDYAIGNGVEVDLEKAIVLMNRGLSLSNAKGDSVYVKMFQSAISKIE